MNKNVYAYLLLGAVVLAGFGGFYFADQTQTGVDIALPTAFSGSLHIEVGSVSDYIAGDSDGDGFDQGLNQDDNN